MLMNWLEPSIEKSIDTLLDSYTKNDRFIEINNKFIKILNELNQNCNIGSKYPELEDLFLINAALINEHSYRAGFGDAINLSKLSPLHLDRC